MPFKGHAMAYNEQLGNRLREAFLERDGVTERKMFGGLAFMVDGNMCCGVTGGALMVRVGKEGYAAAIQQPYARPMDFTGRVMKGFVYVDAAGIASDKDLMEWVQRGLAYVLTLPPK
jgi:TfoX/Sxy family transcriptional regulator of competence genes